MTVMLKQYYGIVRFRNLKLDLLLFDVTNNMITFNENVFIKNLYYESTKA